MNPPNQVKQNCAVGGLVKQNAMCRFVIVGGNQCGYDGRCEHQRQPEEIECCHTRKCGWRGMWADLISIPSKSRAFRGLSVSDNTCPGCGGKEFYRLDQEQKS